MDCHRCIFLRHDGAPYGHCVHRGHGDVVFSREAARQRAKEGVRVYNKQICPDFVLKRRCSNCVNWVRGEYFADGVTPAVKGHCSLARAKQIDCPEWAPGPTSWRKRRKYEASDSQDAPAMQVP